MDQSGAWIDWTRDGLGHEKADYDDARSAISSGEFTYQDPFDPDAGDCFLNYDRNAGTLAEVLILPATLMALIVRGAAWQALSSLAACHFHARPIKVRTRDRMLADYMAVKPAESVACIDLDRSIGIEWTMPLRFTQRWHRLVFRDNCLGDLPWAREEFTSSLVVNDTLCTVLTEIDPKGVNFVRPEDMISPARPRKKAPSET